MELPGPFALAVSRRVLRAVHEFHPDGRGPRGLALARRAATRWGWARRRFDLDQATFRLAAVAKNVDDLEGTYALLADEQSRQVYVDLWAFKVLGLQHAPTPVTVEQHARMCREVERTTAPDGRFELDGPAGTPIRLRGPAFELASIYKLGQYRFATDGVNVAARPGDVVLDGGAAGGDTALWFADLVGEPGHVHAVEFAPANLVTLADNLGANPRLASRVTVHECALWDSSGERLRFSEDGSTTTVGTEGALEVETMTIDDVVARGGLERLDFVKLDVEGAEPNVLRGATETLRRLRPTVAVALYHDPEHFVSLPAFLHELDVGYRFHLGHFSPRGAETILFATAR